jgi:uncharacterized membrane protein YdbT with pleckstrin-like domain
MFHIQHLPNARPGEETIFFLRRHWIALAKLFFIVAIAAALPLGVLWVFNTFAENLLLSDGAVALQTMFLSLYYLALITFTCQEFIDYYLDTWMATTERIVSIEQAGLFHRTASELHLENIQDVSATTKGLLQTFLDYGDVVIQTAGSVTHFHFEMVPHPERIRETILRLVERDKARHAQEHRTP